MIYFDHAATSYPKPKCLETAILNYLQIAANPGRSGHAFSITAARSIFETRELLADFFHIDDPLRVVFTQNATHAINLVLRGILKPGDTVLTTDMEHNAVMRPLHFLQSQGVHVRVVPHEQLSENLTPEIKLLVMAQGNNVDGTVYPVKHWIDIARKNGVLTLIDVAQTAGTIPPPRSADYWAVTGHKSLLGPQGIGALILGKDAPTPAPLICGGTGSASEAMAQPGFLPDALEAGTLNGVGIAGWGATLRELQNTPDAHLHKQNLMRYLHAQIVQIPSLKIFMAPPEKNSGILSFQSTQKSVSEIALALDHNFQIACRVGLHCAPATHQKLGTFPEGTVRIAVGATNTKEEIDFLIQALKVILK